MDALAQFGEGRLLVLVLTGGCWPARRNDEFLAWSQKLWICRASGNMSGLSLMAR